MRTGRDRTLTAVAAVVILLAVALIFQYESSLMGPTEAKEGGGAGEGETGTKLRAVETTATGVLPVGTGGGSMSSRDLVTFQVEEGARKVRVVCDGSNGTLGLGDIDMNVYGAKEGYGEDARRKTSATGGSFEVVEIGSTDIEKRFGYGEYTVELINFAGVNLSYDLTMLVFYPADEASGDEGGGDEGGGGNLTLRA